jgi:hypothetical protein
MTSFNGARFLRAQLDSLSAQTVKPAELVVCDDGSKDATLAILADFAASAPFPVRIVHNARRLGYRANFIQAAGLCRGDIIAFCDQDDIWMPEKLARVAASFAADGDVALVYHNAMLITADGATLRPFYDTPPSAPVSPALTLPPWHLGYGYALAFRRDLLAALPYWAGLKDAYHADQPMGHDLFVFMVASTLGSIGYIDECLVQYRQHAGQTIGTAGREAPGFVQRWRYRLEDRRGTYTHLAGVAAANAGVFAALSQDPAARALQARARAGEKAWQSLSMLYRVRADAVGGSAFRRMRAWLRLRAAGAYGEGFWTFGSKAEIKDAVLGVLLAPVVVRFGRVASEGDATCRRGVVT